MKNDEDMFCSMNMGQNFPEYKLFDSAASQQMFESLFSSFDLKDQDEKHLDGNKLRKVGQFLAVIDEATFKLTEQIHKSKIIAGNKVHIHFLNFSKIYEFKVDDVDNFFDDIYYPGANDIMISDNKLSWMLYIDHDCHLYEFRTN